MRHLMLPAHWTQRASLVTDLVKCWGCGGRSIVFTETKNDANELAGALRVRRGGGARQWLVAVRCGGCQAVSSWPPTPNPKPTHPNPPS